MTGIGSVLRLKDVIRQVLHGDAFDILDIESVEWWAGAVANGSVYNGLLRSAPMKGRALLQHIVGRSTFSQATREAVLARYAKRAEHLTTPYQRLNEMSRVLLHYVDDVRLRDIADEFFLPSVVDLRDIWQRPTIVADAATVAELGGVQNTLKVQIAHRAFEGNEEQIGRNTLTMINDCVIESAFNGLNDVLDSPDIQALESPVMQKNVRLHLDALRYCEVAEENVRAYGKMKLLTTGPCYAFYLSEDERSSVVICDESKITIKVLLGLATTLFPESAARIHDVAKVESLLIVRKVSGAVEHNVALTIARADPIIGSLQMCLFDETKDAVYKRACVRDVFDIVSSFSDKRRQHGNLSTSTVMRTERGWFFIDYRSYLYMRKRYVARRGWMGEAPAFNIRFWDTACLLIDIYEKLKFDEKQRHAIIDVLYLTVQTISGNATMDRLVDNVEHTVTFMLTMGNRGVQVEKMTAVVKQSLPDVAISWQRNLCIETAIGGLNVFVPKTTFTQRALNIGERLGGGAYSYVYDVEGKWVAKLTATETENLNVEHAVHTLAANYGFAPHVRDYFPLKDYAMADISYDADNTLLVCLVMDRYDETLRNVMNNALEGRMNEEMFVPKASMTAMTAALQRTFTFVQHFARAGFMHRDLKGDNVMVNRLGEQDMTVRLIDFGFARHTTIMNKIPRTNWREHDDAFDPDITTDDLSWMELPALCTSNVYDMVSLFVDVCRTINAVWENGDTEKKARASVAWKFVRETIVPMLKEAAKEESDAAYVESVRIIDDYNDKTIAWAVLVYVENVGQRKYKTTMNTRTHNFYGRRVRIN